MNIWKAAACGRANSRQQARVKRLRGTQVQGKLAHRGWRVRLKQSICNSRIVLPGLIAQFLNGLNGVKRSDERSRQSAPEVVAGEGEVVFAPLANLCVEQAGEMEQKNQIRRFPVIILGLKNSLNGLRRPSVQAFGAGIDATIKRMSKLFVPFPEKRIVQCNRMAAAGHAKIFPNVMIVGG
ncbi:MAG TPA: hypothetical protein VGO59_01745 [Verrucomicrobiae bacterium]